jgi:hypothetical protein
MISVNEINMTRFILLFIAFTVSAGVFFGQETTISGKVLDRDTKEPLGFAQVVLVNAGIGATTKVDGTFDFSFPHTVIQEDSLIVTYMGYYRKKVHFERGKKQELVIELQSTTLNLSEVVVGPGENPAWRLLDRVIAAKKVNNPDNFPTHTYREYSKVRFDLNHFSDKIKKNFLFRPFDFIWDNVDTTDQGVRFLPVLLIEKAMQHYVRANPRSERTVVEGIQMTGLKGPKIIQFAEDMQFTPNLYENTVVILDKGFISPIHDNYKTHYNYYLIDSTFMANRKSYQIAFKPKNYLDLAFMGSMWIDSADAAIREMNLRFDIQANVNFVRSYMVKQTYAPVRNTYWLPDSAAILADFTVLENQADLTGFFGRKSAVFHHYVVDTVLSRDLFAGLEKVVVSDSAELRASDDWDKWRKGEMTAQEENLFGMMRTLEKDPKFVFRKNLIKSVFSGYIPIKNFLEIGDFYTFYNYNQVEYGRFKFGLRTQEEWSRHFSASAYTAYGLRDDLWKYGGDVRVSLGKKTGKRTHLGGTYSFDIQQLGRSDNQIRIDHLFSSFMQVGQGLSRQYVQDFEGYVEKNWAPGFVTRLSYFNQTYSPTLDNRYVRFTDNGFDTLGSLNAAGIGFTFKFRYLDNDVRAKMVERRTMQIPFLRFPEVVVDFRFADKQVLGSQFDFRKLRIQLQQKVRAGKAGYFHYLIGAGKTFGTVPFPFLDIPYGNQLILNDDRAYNLMQFMEYGADQFVEFNLQHHFEGMIMNRIPLIKKLKWRSFIFAKGYLGTLSAANNQQTYLFPQGMTALPNGQYYEVGFGFENIFKFARMDFTWRLTDINKPNTFFFIVKPSFVFKF